MKAPYLIRSLLITTAVVLMPAILGVSTGDDGVVVMKTAYAHGGGGGGGGGGSGAGGGGGGGGGGGSAGSAASGTAGAASGAGSGSGAAGGGFAYTPELSAIEAFLRSSRAIHSAHEPKVIVRSTFVNAIGQPCRVVEETVTIDRKKVRASGIVCQRANGRWALKR